MICEKDCQILKLTKFLFENYPEQLKEDVSPVDLAITIMQSNKIAVENYNENKRRAGL